MQAIFTSAKKKPQGQGPTGLWAQPTVSVDTFFTVYLRENKETLTAMQGHQTNDYFPFKKKCLHMLSFHVSFNSLENLFWAPMYSQPIRCCVYVCLPPLSLIALCLLICLPLLIHICVLGAPFLPLDICQYGLDLNGPTLSSEVGAGDSLENRPLN